MVKEQWASVRGYEGLYDISTLGQVKSLHRGRMMKPGIGKYGHQQVFLSGVGKAKGFYVHRLVLEAFIGPCPPGLQACHNDGDASNNRVDNLRWGTPSSNQYDRVKHGTHHHANRTHCPHGHPLDAVKHHGDGSFWQRRCRTCLREQAAERNAAKETCPQGHPFDGVAYNPDGSVRHRYCKQCRSESVSKQMTERHAKAREERTHCPHGHLLDGLRKRPGGKLVPYCKTCLRESSRRNHAAKK